MGNCMDDMERRLEAVERWIAATDENWARPPGGDLAGIDTIVDVQEEEARGNERIRKQISDCIRQRDEFGARARKLRIELDDKACELMGLKEENSRLKSGLRDTCAGDDSIREANKKLLAKSEEWREKYNEAEKERIRLVTELQDANAELTKVHVVSQIFHSAAEQIKNLATDLQDANAENLRK